MARSPTTNFVVLLIGSLFLAFPAQAQKEGPADRLMEAPEGSEFEAAQTEAAERIILLEDISPDKRRPPRSELLRWLEAQEKSEREAAEVEAAERGISVEEVLEEKRTRERALDEYLQDRRDKSEKQTINISLITVSILATFIVICLRFRNTISRKWRKQSKAFRTWAFGSIFWAIGAFLIVWLTDPYNTGSFSYLDGQEVFHMISVMVIPPLFFGGLWFGYKRFVE